MARTRVARAGVARAGVARAGVARAGVARAGVARAGVVLVAIAALSLGACGGGDGSEQDSEPKAATVQAVDGSEQSRVTLTDEAAHRIDLHTEAVALEGTGPGTTVPYGAVLYDPQGRTWAYANVDGLTFVREPITVARIAGNVASLTAGPPVGTKVVTVGAPELYGAEIGVGDE